MKSIRTVMPLKSKLPPLPDDAFDGEKESVELRPHQRVDHYFVRVSPIKVKCTITNAGWIDNGEWLIEKGKIVAINGEMITETSSVS